MPTEVADWYELDAKNCIVDLSANWERAAQAGGAGDALVREGILGRSFFGFLAGEQTRMFHEAFFESVRLTHLPRRSEYRCDTPELRRIFEMVVVPLENGRLRIEHHVKRIETRNRRGHLTDFLLEHTRRGGQLHRCSVCLKLGVPGQAAWVESDSLEVQNAALAVKLNYTVCPQCWRENMRVRQVSG